MSPKKSCLRSVFVFLSFYTVHSQNLVINGSFEEHFDCPKEMGSLSQNLKSLIAPTNGSTDYFHECGSDIMGVPQNFNGFQEAFDGNAYAGLYLYSPNDYREYIQLKLSKTLEKGKTYKVSFRLSLAEKSGLSIMEVSSLFCAEPLRLDTNKNLSPRRLDNFKIREYTFMNLKLMGPIYNPEKWVLIEGEYTASGFENYLVFGNFKNDRYSKTLRITPKNKKSLPLAYYYMDKVAVVQIERKRFELNVPFVLNRLQFEFDDYKLTEKAKQEIKKVYLHLKRNPILKVSIYGHTDDLGSENYNKYLSSRRARAVALYLQELGLPQGRIAWEGKGDRQPIYKDRSNKARDANRRVEFVMTKFEDN